MSGSDLPKSRTGRKQKLITEIQTWPPMPLALRRAIRKHSAEIRPFFKVDLAIIERRLCEIMSPNMHSEAAAVVYGIPVEHVTLDQRKIGKILNYASMYSGPFATLKSILETNVRPPRRQHAIRDVRDDGQGAAQ